MADQSSGRPWPLYVIFVVTFVISIVGLVGPRLWGNEPTIPDWALVGLFVTSLVVALILVFSPKISDWFNKGEVLKQLAALSEQAGPDGEIFKKIDATLDEYRADGAARKTLTDIKSALDPASESWTRIEAQLKSLATLDQIAAQFGATGDVGKKLAEIATDMKTALGAGAKLDQLSQRLDTLDSIQKRLDAIEAAVKKDAIEAAVKKDAIEAAVKKLA